MECINKDIDALVEILHVSTGGVETSIGTATTTDTLTIGAGGASLRVAIKIPLTKKSFAIGEKFRVEIITTYDNSIGAGRGRLYHDPTNRITPLGEYPWGGTPDTSLLVLIPFRIDL